MRLHLTSGETRDVPVTSAICGVGVHQITFNMLDMWHLADLGASHPERLADYIDNLLCRYVPEKVKQPAD